MSVTVEEALDLIYKNVTHTFIKILPIEQALGSVLAQDVIATHNLPPFDNSAMDGYAVKIADAGSCVSVKHTIFAGDDSHEILESTKAIKIMTGAKIPLGTQCIVPIEDIQKCDDGILLPQNLTMAKHIRLCGEDIKSGDTILKSRTRLNAHQITLLASQGISHVRVFKKPRIALFASGNELKMHFESVESFQLYNTNTPTFSARAQELGCDVDFIGTSHDTLNDIKLHIISALDSNLIITSGGVSVGDADFTKEAFEAFEYVNIFDKIEIKPGKPTSFGKIGNTYILNLPGNPLAAALNFELFAQSIILALSGESNMYLNTISSKMKVDYKFKKGRKTLIPGFFDGEAFKPSEKFAPGMVSPLATSNSYIMIDATSNDLTCGDCINVIPTRFSFTSKTKVDLVSKA